MREKTGKKSNGQFSSDTFLRPCRWCWSSDGSVEDWRVLSEACGALEATWPREVHSGAKKAERTFGMSSSNEDDPARHGWSAHARHDIPRHSTTFADIGAKHQINTKQMQAMKTFHPHFNCLCSTKSSSDDLRRGSRRVRHTSVSTFDICERPDNVNLFLSSFYYALLLVLCLFSRPIHLCLPGITWLCSIAPYLCPTNIP